MKNCDERGGALLVECVPVGMLRTNCYIVRREGRPGEAVAVDPGDDGAGIARLLKERGATDVSVLLTHAHFDHILGVNELAEAFPSGRVYISEEERPMVEDDRLNSGFYEGECRISPDVWLREGDEPELLGGPVKVLRTPGHTAGSVCYYFPEDGMLFSGDTLFFSGCGRTDLPTGSPREMADSLERILTSLPEDTAVFPGHGPQTTIGRERIIEGY